MPRISDVFTHCAVYIYGSLEDARNGEQYGGSGFLCHVPFKKNVQWSGLYVVTNWHVVECIPTDRREWFRHSDGDDVAVFPLFAEYDELKIWSIETRMFVTPQLILDEDIGIGDDVVMVGRFVNHEGKQKNSPAVRFGNIAMMADEKIETDFGTRQEAFLVEVRSLPGYSGSAVLIYSPCAMNDMSQRRYGRGRVALPDDNKFRPIPLEFFDHMNAKGPYLLGIDFCHLHRRSDVLDQTANRIAEKWFIKENTGMAGVIPAWKILEVLNRQELQIMRDEADRQMSEGKNTAGPSDIAVPNASGSQTNT